MAVRVCVQPGSFVISHSCKTYSVYMHVFFLFCCWLPGFQCMAQLIPNMLIVWTAEGTDSARGCIWLHILSRCVSCVSAMRELQANIQRKSQNCAPMLFVFRDSLGAHFDHSLVIPGRNSNTQRGLPNKRPSNIL
jgi:hypothetical protein